MVIWTTFSFCRDLFRGEIILNYHYLLYGLGHANEAVKRYFSKHGVSFKVYCDKEEGDLLSILKGIDLIIKSPGIPFDTPLLKEAALLNVKVIGDLELFFLFNKASNIICVTGTNGKTTTCYLLYQLLKRKYIVALAGNIGIPLFSVIDEAFDFIIIEASSYMLASTEFFHPHIVILLNLYPNHLDIHKTFSNYVESKLKAVRNIDENDYIVYNQDDILIKDLIINLTCNKIAFSTKTNNNCYDINLDEILLLKGRHNKENVKAALTLAKMLDVSKEEVIDVLKNFVAPSHRIEKVYENNQLVIFNDSKATNGLATKEAIRTIWENYQAQIIWIAGGQERNEKYELLNEVITKVNLAFIYGANKLSLSNYLIEHQIPHCLYDNLEEVIKNLPVEAQKPTAILFSPATPSHDQYHSFEERGDHFKTLISKYYVKNDKIVGNK